MSKDWEASKELAKFAPLMRTVSAVLEISGQEPNMAKLKTKELVSSMIDTDISYRRLKYRVESAEKDGNSSVETVRLYFADKKVKLDESHMKAFAFFTAIIDHYGLVEKSAKIGAQDIDGPEVIDLDEDDAIEESNGNPDAAGDNSWFLEALRNLNKIQKKDEMKWETEESMIEQKSLFVPLKRHITLK